MIDRWVQDSRDREYQEHIDKQLALFDECLCDNGVFIKEGRAYACPQCGPVAAGHTLIKRRCCNKTRCVC